MNEILCKALDHARHERQTLAVELEGLGDRRALLEDRIKKLDAAIAAVVLLDASSTIPETAADRLAGPSPVAKALRAKHVEPMGGVRNDVTAARDSAILRRLTSGPATVQELLEALPKERDQNHTQRYAACQNAITRLKVRRKVTKDGERWRLAGGVA